MGKELERKNKERTLYDYHGKQRNVIRDLLELLYDSFPHGLQKKHFYKTHSKGAVDKNVEVCLNNGWMVKANDRFEITEEGIGQLGDIEREFVHVEMDVSSGPLEKQESGVVSAIASKGVIGETPIPAEVPPEDRKKVIRKWAKEDFFPAVQRSLQRLRSRGVPAAMIKYVGVSK